jgi:hypothetical protein
MDEQKPKQPAAGWGRLKYKEDSRPRRGWWAPGGYLRECVKCNERFVGDKRAGWCADCAYKWEAADDSDKPPLAGRSAFDSSAWIGALRERMESEGRLEDTRREESDYEAARMHGHAAAVIQDLLRQMESAPIDSRSATAEERGGGGKAA